MNFCRLLVLLSVFSALNIAAMKGAVADSITWFDGSCQRKIEFSSKKYDRETLNNTVRLAYGLNFVSRPDVFWSVQSKADIDRLDLVRARNECTRSVEQLNSAKLLDIPGIEDARHMEVEKTERLCNWQEMKILVLKGHGSALHDFEPARTCTRYVDALDGRTSFDDVWREVVSKACSNNMDPAGCQNRAYIERQSADGQQLSRIYVFNFGWNKCMVRAYPIQDPNTKSDYIFSQLQTHIIKKLKPRKYDCEGPVD